MRPIMDNLEQLIDSNEEERYKDENELKGKIEEIFERGLIQAEALNFIRGRSLIQTYLIIDEAQNTTPNQIKGIITRAGKIQRLSCWEIPIRLTGHSWMSVPTDFLMQQSI